MSKNKVYVKSIRVTTHPELYKLAIEDLAKKMDIVLYAYPISDVSDVSCCYLNFSFLTTSEKKDLFYKELKNQYDLS